MDDRENDETVCCMCGDVGFPGKLFRCSKCRNRFQHTYCSNYYGEHGDLNEICDWCNSNSSPSPPAAKHAKHREEARSSGEKGAPGKAPSPRTPTRRYKLLKDVMC